ncbi:unnamed protein product [Paramecium primaurelia]|uniref:Tetratricopeptide repeat protein n=1 Tax=Paramecium primaurelia TaxID=5886 RepID=A0A8S1M0F5_PARPR|nr:unnamed protein product [Paramecium primaurelia]
MSQDFSQAVAIYEQLVKYYPEIDDYKIYLAQSYYKDSLYDETLKICASVENSQYQGKILQLQALIRYEKNEFQHAKTQLKQNDMDDPDSIIT